MSQFKLLLPEEYFEDLLKNIRHARHRINIVALTVVEDDSTKIIFDELVAAASRGVTVDIGMDIYFTYRELEATRSRWSYLRKQGREMRATRKRLTKAGARVHWLSKFGITLFSRRTHTKWTIIDDVIYSFGGVNIHASGFKNKDFMLRIKDHTLADLMSEEHARLIKADSAGRSYRNHVFGQDDNLVLIDGGRSGRSLIYRHALLHAEEAESVIYVSQYSPSGKLGAILRSTNTKTYFNRWQSADNVIDRLNLWLGAKLHSFQSSYKSPEYLHAKYLIFTLPGGKMVAITGSHNFIPSNGLFGTREVALETRDPKIIRQLLAFTDSLSE